MKKNILKSKKSSDPLKIDFYGFLKRPPTFNLGSLCIVICLTFLMLMATITQLPVGFLNWEFLFHPFRTFTDFNSLMNVLIQSLYIPIIPVVLFSAVLLGARLSVLTVVLYLLIGLLGFPIFSGGGGLMYLFKPTFGFLLSFVIVAFIVGRILELKTNLITLITVPILGVLMIHLIGDFYMFINLMFGGQTLGQFLSLLWHLSLVNIPYDIVFSLILCILAKPIRGLIWVIVA